MRYTFTLIAVISVICCTTAQNNVDRIEKYLSALVSTMHGESTSKDVDKLIELYSEDIVYEHPKFGIRIETRKTVKEGLNSFIGSYGGKEGDAQIIKSNQIIGTDVIIVEFEINFLTNDNKKIKRKQI